jgi:hypothetical protein
VGQARKARAQSSARMQTANAFFFIILSLGKYIYRDSPAENPKIRVWGIETPPACNSGIKKRKN